MKIIIDSGHGINTKGKCSPDGQFKEWAYCRELAKETVSKLRQLNYDAIDLMEGITEDESLRNRCVRINTIAKKEPSILISLHNNAAGSDGKWHTARGWCIYVSLNASQKSKKLAAILQDQAIKQEVTGNRYIPKDKYWQKNLGICRDTICPAVLVENMFMDNKQDVEFLKSPEGKRKLIKVIVDGVQEYINQM